MQHSLLMSAVLAGALLGSGLATAEAAPGTSARGCVPARPLHAAQRLPPISGVIHERAPRRRVAVVYGMRPDRARRYDPVPYVEQGDLYGPVYAANGAPGVVTNRTYFNGPGGGLGVYIPGGFGPGPRIIHIPDGYAGH